MSRFTNIGSWTGCLVFLILFAFWVYYLFFVIVPQPQHPL